MKSALLLTTIQSYVQTLEIPENGVTDAAKEYFGKNDAFVAAYLDYAVMIGRYHGGKFLFHDNCGLDYPHIRKIRIFNSERELYAWRGSGPFSARLRVDNEGAPMEVIDACQVLSGTRSESRGDFSLLTEERGTEIYLPFRNIQVDDEKQRIFLTTRNYVAYNVLHQAGYCDCRFTGFLDHTGSELK